MSYTVLARRYRSRDFEEVIGQEPIARTLKRAIESDRTAHAYLFCGTRGVGKTSMARIFAKALNVVGELQDAEAINQAIMIGNDIDVIEIDGASNRGVDDARDLISNSIYRPSRCPYKIYIIDEVHMLTREAFNALLKTMEEPPEHVKFILCTTEPHKVPATIQSRCQRFDFRSISTTSIAAHLKTILKQEKVKAEDRVLHEIARLGHGSMRDALSLLDRLLSAGDEDLTASLIEDMLGLPDQDLIASLIDAWGAGDPALALSKADELLRRGNSLDQLIEVCIERLRTLMLVSTCGTESELIDLARDDCEAAAKQAKQFDVPAIVYMIVLLENVQRSVKTSSTGRALFDAAVVRLAMAENFADVTALLRSGGGAQKKTLVNRAPTPTPPPAPRAPAPVVSRAPASPPPAATPSPAAEPAATSTIELKDWWPKFIQRAKGRPELSLAVEAMDQPAGTGGAKSSLTIPFRNPSMLAFARMQLPSLQTLATEIAGYPVRFTLEAAVKEESSSAPTNTGMASVVTDESRREAASFPLVKKAMELLDARIVNVCNVETPAPAPAPTNDESE